MLMCVYEFVVAILENRTVWTILEKSLPLSLLLLHINLL